MEDDAGTHAKPVEMDTTPETVEPLQSTNWSARDLYEDQIDGFEHAVLDLYDWVAYSDVSEEEVMQHFNASSSPAAQDRQRLYYAAIVKYMVVEPVMCAEDDEHGTLASKLEKLVSLVGELVRKSIIDVQLIDEQIEVICLDDEAYLMVVGGDDSHEGGQKKLAMFQNFHDFATTLYKKGHMTSLMPACKALDSYFGQQPLRNALTFHVVTRWLIYGYKDIYEADQGFQSRWPYWYSVICQETAGYGKKDDKESTRLEISGRVAQKRMEDMSGQLRDFDISVRKAMEEAANEPGESDFSTTAAEKFSLVGELLSKMEAMQVVPDQAQ